MALMPHWIPRALHAPAVYISGVAEICGGVGLLVPNCDLQMLAGWGLIALLAAVFPANINMAFDARVREKLRTTQSQALMRLPFQFVFWVWVYQLTPKSCP